MVNKIIITGSPCSGKTTLIKELEKKGYSIIQEAAREVIEKETKKRTGILPWNGEKNFERFQYKVFDKQLELESNIENNDNKLYFLDRGFLDIISYCKLRNVQVPRILIGEYESSIPDYIKSIYSQVFFLETLPENLYINDDSRKEKYSTAIKISNQLKKDYKSSGLPFTFLSSDLGIQGRLEKILATI